VSNYPKSKKKEISETFVKNQKEKEKKRGKTKKHTWLNTIN
jgi:hypothetical protein